MAKKVTYPFSAIVGREKLKRALLVNLVDPTIGGLLIVGPKGTGKSTTVRAAAEIAPEIEVVDGCQFNCDPNNPMLMCEKCRMQYERKGKLKKKKIKMPFVELPISSTEDRVLGSIDLEKALKNGEKQVEPGLLAQANRGILYIDEVNLLPDNISDIILDAAASGWNIVEREGVTLTHPSRFILIGTMNPEEGWLRPQILDRFPLCIKVKNSYSVEERKKIMERNLEFEEDPENFILKWKPKQEELKKRIINARKILSNVKIDSQLEEKIVEFCLKLKVDGHRADIAIIKTAKALAALEGREKVKLEDIMEAAELALAHRTRLRGFEEPLPPEEIREKLMTTITTQEEEDRKERIEQIKVKVEGEGKMPSPAPPPKVKKKKSRIPIPIIMLLIFVLYYFLFYFIFAAGSIMMSGILNMQWESIAKIMKKDIFIWSAIALLIYTILQFISRRKKPIPPIRMEIETGLEEKTVKAKRIFIHQHLVASPPKEQSFGARAYQFISLLGAKILTKYRAAIEKGRKIANNIYEILSSPQPTFKIKLSPEHMRGKKTRTEVVRGTWIKRGKYVKHALPKDKPLDIAIAPTLRAAAVKQKFREKTELAINVKYEDLRVKIKEYRAPLCIIILLDLSESMITSIDNVKSAIRGLHKGAHRQRDKVGLIVFKGTRAEVLQHPTTNLRTVVEKLVKVGVSDFTPLAAGMQKAYEVLKMEKMRNREIIPVMVIISDGIVNVPLKNTILKDLRKHFLNPAQADVLEMAKLIAKEKIRTIIINTDHRPKEIYKKIYYGISRRAISYTPTALLMEIANITGGKYYGLRPDQPLGEIVIQDIISEMVEIPVKEVEMLGVLE
ncbi:MAG TPA: VWA domain-containing protein [Candidatus Bathyarchaeota archaeon]|nr:VWA domain-containing protein [Candidatus Bathyarchaeota archaeon]